MVLGPSLACANGDLRINSTNIPGGSTLAGRLEVCYNNTWGTVCSDGYGPQEAVVACRQMGFSDAGAHLYKYIDNAHC